MDMTSQLLETKLAGGGQQREEEESFGTGRGGAHNYSGGAGRAPPSADIGYGVTAVGVVAAAEVPVHSRRAASEPTTPADGIGKRPDVPAGVGPTVNMYSGEARESYLAGIAAHDGGSVRVCACVCVCFLPIRSGHQVRWMYQPGSHRRKITQDFSSTFFLRCVP